MTSLTIANQIRSGIRHARTGRPLTHMTFWGTGPVELRVYSRRTYARALAIIAASWPAEVRPQDPPADVTVLDHGSLAGVWPLSERAKDWIAENVSDDASWFGRQLVVEPRYLEDLLAGMVADGLVVA